MRMMDVMKEASERMRKDPDCVAEEVKNLLELYKQRKDTTPRQMLEDYLLNFGMIYAARRVVHQMVAEIKLDMISNLKEDSHEG